MTMKRLWYPLFIAAQLYVLAAMVCHGASVTGPLWSKTPYAATVTITNSYGKTMVYGSKGEWLYNVHFPYHVSVHAGTSTTLYQSASQGMAAFLKPD